MARRPVQVAKRDRRKLIAVFDKKALSEVRARKNLKRVPPRSLLLPIVRRNRKIQKVLRMGRNETEKQVKMTVVTTKSASLSEASCIYRKQVLEVLQHPKKFVYVREMKIKGTKVWNITKEDSGSVIMQTEDKRAKELEFMRGDLEGDIGVLKESVQQLLAQTTNDVIAINTHPGHHAGPARVAGFCAINNNAVAAQLIKQRNSRLKLGVIDIDVHPGDGTKLFLKQHQGLFHKFASIHTTATFYNMNSDLGTNGFAMKLDRNRKVTKERFIGKIEEILNTWNQSDLDIVLVSLGFDTLKRDALDRLGFQMFPEDFHDVGYVFAKRQEQILFLQEGGYNIEETGSAFHYLVKGFREGRKTHT